MLAVPGPAVWCVLGGVLLSRTLAGAVPSALSGLASGFGMECRAFPCRCDHRDDYMGSAGPSSLVRLFGYWAAYPRTLVVCVVGGWVGCGPYSGRFALLWLLTPAFPRTLSVCGVWGCCCLCWPISTSQLFQPLPVFHSWPINPVVCWGPTKKDKSFLRRPYLEDGFPLRCFQRLPFPNVANQPCPGRDNWHTRGSSVPVLSY